MSRFELVELAELRGEPCPCGTTRRAFGDQSNGVASMHLVEIQGEAQTHYHKQMTELYYILAGTGAIELDGRRFPVYPGMAILIKPECRHRAIGTLQLLNIPIPAFDPADEWFDRPSESA